MEALIKKVTAAAGITDEQAKIAIETVAATLKEKLPTIMQTNIDVLINGGTLTDVMKKQMGDLADRTEGVMEEMKDRATEIGEDMKNKFNDMFNKK